MNERTALSVCIAIPTFRRPAELAACLAGIAEHLAQRRATLRSRLIRCRVVVIDNDAAASARAVIDAGVHSPLEVRYAVEPHPGIAAARNRALQEADDADVLVFIDDDERPSTHWLLPLIETWERTGAAVVVGRVISVFDAPLDPWVTAGEFFRRRSMPTGTELTVGAAGNMLVDLMQIRHFGVRFDERLGFSAGEDSLFTSELVRRGGRLVWCEESVATDHVPPDRVTRHWVLERARSHGNAEVMVALLSADDSSVTGLRLTAALRGCIRVLAGAARFAAGGVAGSLRHRARGLRTVYRGLGMTAAALGIAVNEYAREPDHATV